MGVQHYLQTNRRSMLYSVNTWFWSFLLTIEVGKTVHRISSNLKTSKNYSIPIIPSPSIWGRTSKWLLHRCKLDLSAPLRKVLLMSQPKIVRFLFGTVTIVILKAGEAFASAWHKQLQVQNLGNEWFLFFASEQHSVSSEIRLPQIPPAVSCAWLRKAVHSTVGEVFGRNKSVMARFFSTLGAILFFFSKVRHVMSDLSEACHA